MESVRQRDAQIRALKETVASLQDSVRYVHGPGPDRPQLSLSVQQDPSKQPVCMLFLAAQSQKLKCWQPFSTSSKAGSCWSDWMVPVQHRQSSEVQDEMLEELQLPRLLRLGGCRSHVHSSCWAWTPSS